ncbi:hypothetical protein KUTeg_014607 [Tegillarca granosa]|uniref:Uncharacterized protein n=1 Tax=Tegillarca granosa TaxID=220873 RepID=A0ABQ9ERG6_TEGGR|nr:hypothetical protein KUTeg_014607 [Tegillarca granosa]
MPCINTNENCLDPGDVPECLKGLSLMEKRLISGQFGEKGLAIDFPVNMQQNIETLPHKFGKCNIITVSYRENKDIKPTHVVRKKNFEHASENVSEYDEFGTVNIDYDIPCTDLKKIINFDTPHLKLPKCNSSPVNAYDFENVFMRKRTKAIIIRLPRLPLSSDDYFFSLLMSFLPHRNDKDILFNHPSPFSHARDAFIAKKDQMKLDCLQSVTIIDEIENAVRFVQYSRIELMTCMNPATVELENDCNEELVSDISIPFNDSFLEKSNIVNSSEVNNTLSQSDEHHLHNLQISNMSEISKIKYPDSPKLYTSYIIITAKSEVGMCQPFEIPAIVKTNAPAMPGSQSSTLSLAIESPEKSIITVRRKITKETEKNVNGDKINVAAFVLIIHHGNNIKCEKNHSWFGYARRCSDIVYQHFEFIAVLYLTEAVMTLYLRDLCTDSILEIILKDGTAKTKVAIWDKMVGTIEKDQLVKLTNCRKRNYLQQHHQAVSFFPNDEELDDVSSDEDNNDEPATLQMPAGTILAVFEVDPYLSCSKSSCNNTKLITLKEENHYYMFCKHCTGRYNGSSANTFLRVIVLLEGEEITKKIMQSRGLDATIVFDKEEMLQRIMKVIPLEIRYTLINNTVKDIIFLAGCILHNLL